MTYSEINDSFINLTKLIFSIDFVRYTCYYLIYKISYSSLLHLYPVCYRQFSQLSGPYEKSLVIPALGKVILGELNLNLFKKISKVAKQITAIYHFRDKKAKQINSLFFNSILL